MTNLLRLPSALLLGGLLLLAACGDKGEQSAASSKAGESSSEGQGQVVARVNGEEITVHQLNAELATIPGQTAATDQVQLQQEMLRAIVYRTLLRQEAEKAGMDKNPQVKMLIDGASDKILAEAYVTQQTGTTPPPTSTEIDKFVSDNPLSFGDRRIYQFQRLTMPADKYSQELVPLFDQKQTFGEFQAYLNERDVPYTLAEVRLPSTDFPKQVQDELVRFGVGDNVVVRGQQSIVILKIMNWLPMPVEQQDAQRMAQNALHQQALQERARSMRDQISHAGKVEFYGEFADMKLEPPKQEAPAPAPAPSATPPAAEQPAGGATSQ